MSKPRRKNDIDDNSSFAVNGLLFPSLCNDCLKKKKKEDVILKITQENCAMHKSVKLGFFAFPFKESKDTLAKKKSKNQIKHDTFQRAISSELNERKNTVHKWKKVIIMHQTRPSVFSQAFYYHQ